MTTPTMSLADQAAHEAASYVRRQPTMPRAVSDDFLRALSREDRRQVPAEERRTCPNHLDWRDRCQRLHEAVSS
ncbi:hypothetical protein [Streptomyces formicae]